ncbi:WNT1-inducible-signaling pathway protein 2 [Heterocephalus glaber]|uniref:CCN family member 5 n=1 Tax=Heterocephalus glaber TaxID=10181 RepID=G5BB33_HETGA|nr:WNT1-inducible-signaling pathway protein 2 [Heterocephalus glaber]
MLGGTGWKAVDGCWDEDLDAEGLVAHSPVAATFCASSLMAATVAKLRSTQKEVIVGARDGGWAAKLSSEPLGGPQALLRMTPCGGVGGREAWPRSRRRAPAGPVLDEVQAPCLGPASLPGPRQLSALLCDLRCVPSYARHRVPAPGHSPDARWEHLWCWMVVAAAGSVHGGWESPATTSTSATPARAWSASSELALVAGGPCAFVSSEDVRLPSADCPWPRRVELPGKCCPEWVCDQGAELGAQGDQFAGLVAPLPPGVSCPQWSTAWGPCSTTCGLGMTTRVSNQNHLCRLETQHRLCLPRPCPPARGRSPWNGAF